MDQGKAKSLVATLCLCVLLFGTSWAGSARGRAEVLQAVPLPDVASVDWALQVPDEPITLTGVVSFDNAGNGAGSMLYPAPHAVGLLAAIVTHGIIESSMKRKQRDKLQEAANQILVPYQPTLANYSNKDVALAALARRPFGDRKSLVASPGAAATSWRIESTPRFSLTQDQRAFTLDNAIVLYSPGSTVPAYRTAVRVVSHPRDGVDFISLWTADHGAELKKEWGNLFAESIDVALRTQAAKPGDGGAAFETVRYSEGSTQKIERAQPLYEECGRLVLKTLRGALMSVPAQAKADASVEAGICPHL
ncbi:MAG: hypothetical protein ACREPE_02990 [Lysobacter sp.]